MRYNLHPDTCVQTLGMVMLNATPFPHWLTGVTVYVTASLVVAVGVPDMTPAALMLNPAVNTVPLLTMKEVGALMQPVAAEIV
jgi:hypothetical protein